MNLNEKEGLIIKMKIAFFDVDGTLCNSYGKVLPSSIKAIRQFRAEKNLAFLCTGRSLPEITEDIVAVGFDGIIGAGGGYIEVSNEVIYQETMRESDVLEIINYFQKYDIGYYLESNEGLFGSGNCIDKIREEVAKQAVKERESFDAVDQKLYWFYELLKKYLGKPLDCKKINKISFINNTLAFNQIYRKYSNKFLIHHTTVPLFGPNSGEIAMKGLDKQRAIKQVLEYLKLTAEDAIAFGDGDNDLSMFKAVGYSIAMGNATTRLKMVADEITDDADEDGIQISLDKKGWLTGKV